MVLTLILCAFAACGVLLVGRTLLDSIFLPVSCVQTVLAVRLCGSAAAVEQTVRACLRLRSRRPELGSLLFVDEGMDPEGQRIARLALRGQENAFLCGRAQIEEFIRWEK